MPNRIIKESICRSDTINFLKPFEEVLFYRLIVVCDDYGRFDGRPEIIKGSCFPLKDTAVKDIGTALKRLVEVGLVELYEVHGKPVLQLSTWSAHQQIRAKKSKYPSPDDEVKNQSPGRSDTGLYTQKTSSEIICNQLISDDSKCPRNRESKYENRESYSRKGNACARETGEVRRFEDFLSAYPKDCNRFLAEHEYASLLLTRKITEDELIQCASNYAEAMRIKETPEEFISNAENFLKKFVFEQYLPGKYKKPVKQKSRNSFNNFPQREYDFEELEKQLLSNNLRGD